MLKSLSASLVQWESLSTNGKMQTFGKVLPVHNITHIISKITAIFFQGPIPFKIGLYICALAKGLTLYVGVVLKKLLQSRLLL